MSRVGPLNATAIGRLGALADHGGYLQLNGPLRIPLSRGGNTTADIRVIFPQHGARDLTTHTIGLVQSGTSVEEIESQYPTLSDLLSAMFHIISEPKLEPAGAGLFYAVPVTEFEAGTSANVVIMLNMDRGVWSPVQTSGGAIPYGVVNTAKFTHPITGELINLTPPNEQLQTRLVSMSNTKNVQISSTLALYRSTLGEATTAAGELAYNSAQLSSQEVARDWFTSNSFTIRNYKNVWRNTIGTLNDLPPDTTQSGLASTPRLYVDSSDIYVSRHFDEEILIPDKQPMYLSIYDNIFSRSWRTQPLDDVWSKRFEDGYWVVKMLNTYRVPGSFLDLRISF